MSNTFEHLGLPEQMESALAKMNFTNPTPIQSRCIPVAMEGRDILGSAQTGTGKTAAFCIPMIAKLMADPDAMALVLTPTRELATQILDVVHKLTSNNRAMRTALLIGGDSMGKQFAQLRERPRLVVGTPGRINDHLRRDPRLLSKVVFVAIDEADRMLDMGFSVQLDEILKTLPKDRQTLMFSATFPDTIVKFSRNYLNNPERISVNPESVTVTKIKHEVKRTTDANKYIDLLAELEVREGSVIIFAKTQHGTDRLAKRLENDNHGAVAIHGGLRQNQRDKAVQAFRSKRYRIMVATDVASRGLDIPHIEHVINYDLPQVAEDYVHRIGRTARAGAEGNAMAFVLPSDGIMWNQINRIMNPDAPMEKFHGPQTRGGYGKSGGGYKGNKDRSFGNARGGERGGFGGERRDREDRKFPSRDGKAFGSGERNARPPRAENGDRPSYNNDRPRADRPQSEKPFVKYYDKNGAAGGQRVKPVDANWNTKPDRPRYNADGGKFEQPRSEGRGDGRQGNDRFGGDRPQGNRPQGEKRPYGDRPHNNGGDRPQGNFKPRSEGRDGAKPFFKKDDGFKKGGFKSEHRSFGDRPKFDRPAGDKPMGDRPQRDRNHRFDGTPRDRTEGNVKPRSEGFKPEGKRSDAPRKPRADAGAAKKPFKFKEHSRKGPPSGAPKNRVAV